MSEGEGAFLKFFLNSSRQRRYEIVKERKGIDGEVWR
jgi:hypothetical protein